MAQTRKMVINQQEKIRDGSVRETRTLFSDTSPANKSQEKKREKYGEERCCKKGMTKQRLHRAPQNMGEMYQAALGKDR
jgi:hypothetical protein